MSLLEDVAAVLRDRPACSVEDSVADLDLTSAGFRVLLDATSWATSTVTTWLRRARPAWPRSDRC